MVFYERRGRTYVRERADTTHRRRRTKATMINLTSWSNNINLWKQLSPFITQFFTNLREGSTSYNRFVSLNSKLERVYLTKQQAKDCGCVITPVCISEGNLPTIHVEEDETGLLTNICLSGLTIGPGTTIRDLAEAVVRNNDGYAHGDVLVFLLGDQREEYGCPQARFSCQSVTLDMIDGRLLSAVMEPSIGFGIRDDRLASTARPLGGMAWVHLRKVGTKWLVSQQSLVTNTESLLSRYGSEEAFRTAATSYGGIDKPDLIEPDRTSG